MHPSIHLTQQHRILPARQPSICTSPHLSVRSRSTWHLNMAENIYDEIEIEDMTYDPALEIYHYPCPCGDRFEIAIADLRDNEDIAVCPSCSLMIKVIFEVDDLPKPEEDTTTAEETTQVPVTA
ncbi:Diphthamide biosynthesis protein 3 [Cadophora gregata f. sp. sojae]|nr:Diphthamide biosynthesis protein 3 [Cadophora gregata f. sp. sojae]